MRKLSKKPYATILPIIFLFYMCYSFSCWAVTDKNMRQIFFEVSINQYNTKEVWLFLQDDSDIICVSQNDLKKWHIKYPAQPCALFEGIDYYNLRFFKGMSYDIDTKNMRINITIPSEWFEENIAAETNALLIPERPGVGGYINYDAVAQNTTNSNLFSGVFTPTFFNSFGSLVSGFLYEHNSGKVYLNQPILIYEPNKLLRLNTTWQSDFPFRMETLRLGDSFSTPGTWGRSVGFGGIQFGTNFNTQPSFITFPLPSSRGAAVVPSVVDLYVDNALIAKREIPAGPFAIEAIPVITGAGTVNIVTTDLMGRQQITNLPYYASSSLLRPGLHDYSYEIGFIRQNYGVESNDYADFLLVGTNRFGILNSFTAEWHLELMRNQQTIGLSSSYLISLYGIATLSAATSHNDALGNGQLVMLGFQHQALHGINFGLSAQMTTNKFTQIGFSPNNQPAPSFTGIGYIAFPVFSRSSFALSYIQQNFRNKRIDAYPNNNQINFFECTVNECAADEFNTGLMSASYNQNLGGNWSLNLSTLNSIRGPNNNNIFLTLTRAFGAQTTLNMQAINDNNQTQATGQLQRALPVGPGWGYNIYGSSGSEQGYYASLSAQIDQGNYTITAARQLEQNGYQLEARGAMVLMPNELHFTRYVGNSFAIVQVPGYPNVKVYIYNQEVAKTNSHGSAFVPNLLSYQANPIAIEPTDLPLNAEIDVIEKKPIPYYNSGLLVTFPARKANAATLSLFDPQGIIVASGTLVKDRQNQHSFFVANNGLVYLTHLTPGQNQFNVLLDKKLCQFSIYYQETSDPLPDLGTVLCEEVNVESH